MNVHNLNMILYQYIVQHYSSSIGSAEWSVTSLPETDMAPASQNRLPFCNSQVPQYLESTGNASIQLAAVLLHITFYHRSEERKKDILVQ